MAVKRIELYPTSDIHLLLQGPDGNKTTYQLHVRDYFKTSTNLSGVTAKTKYTSEDPTIATVSATGLVTPLKVGETICRIRHTDTTTGADPKTFVSELLVRIRVHDELDDIWIGNNRATLFKGEKSYVLTVYGHFTDGTIGDVSSHPYLTFSSPDTGKVRVDNSSDKGRLEGRNTTGNTPVKVEVKYKAVSREVSVFVGKSLTSTRRILKRIHGSGNVSKRRNILLLAEGFTAAEKPLFMRMATLIKDRLFEEPLHEPFNLLKDQFNFWVAFDPSGEDGVGCGSPVTKAGVQAGAVTSRAGDVIARHNPAGIFGHLNLQQVIVQVGLPDRYHPLPTNKQQAEAAWPPSFNNNLVDTNVRNHWLSLREYHLMQARDTRLGFIQGPRYGDRDSTRVLNPAATPRSVMEWYLSPKPSHWLEWDRRRLPKHWGSLGYLRSYLGSLRLANGSRGPVDHWLKGGKDRGLVAYLIKSGRDGGTRSSLGVRATTHADKRYRKMNVSGRVADYEVPELIPLVALPYVAGTSTTAITSILAHEFGHAFSLGDEYEGQGMAGTRNALKQADEPTRKSIDRALNLTHLFRIEKAPAGPGTIDVNKVNWVRWMRVERAAVLTQNPTSLSGGRLRVKIPRAERINWVSAEIDGRDVYLRSRAINSDNESNKAFPQDGPLKIQSLQQNGTMVLSGVTLSGFKKGDVLFLPELDGGKELTVFHPAVLKHLQTNGEPFAKKANASVANTSPSEPPTSINDPTFKPRIAAFTIGVYEGGGTFNTKVYRPAGTCKMRDHERIRFKEKPLVVTPADDFDIFKENAVTVTGQPQVVKRFVPFCYVCKYALANTLDPRQLERISYPP